MNKIRTGIVIVILTVCYSMIGLQARSQTADSIQAARFLQLNQAGKFSQARAMFAPSALRHIPARALQQVWETRVKPYGPLHSFTVTRSVQADSLHALVVATGFRDAVITMSFSFNRSHQMEGYFILGVVPKTEAGKAPPVAGKDTLIIVPGGRIAGSLLIPPSASRPPVVLIIAGSGAVDRNGNEGALLRSNAYLLLADLLAAHGIASFRYDKRLTGKSTSFTEPADQVRFGDFVRDAAALASFLEKDARFSEVFVIGHSEGSLIGMLAAEKTRPAGFISIAGVGERIGRLIRWQLSSQPGLDQGRIKRIVDSLRAGHEVKDIPASLFSLFGPRVQPYLISWMRYDPAKEIAKLDMPVLIVNGTHDLQVPVTQAERLHQGKPDARMVLIPGMNHTMKDAPMDRSKNLETYGKPELPLDSLLVKKVVAFIKQAASHSHS